MRARSRHPSSRPGISLLAIAVFLLFFAGFFSTRAYSITECGDGICSATESRSACPQDCCLTFPDGACEWFDECKNHDPDCCTTGACYSDQYLCEASTRGEDCYPGWCYAGVCDSSCASFIDCSSGFCAASCSDACVENGYPAADLESCCECYSAGMCEPCHALQVRGLGFFVYRERTTALPIELYNATSVLTNVTVVVSGPLMDYISLGSTDPSWKGDGFSRMNPGEIKSFSITLKDIPDDLAGMHQAKFSITYEGGSASHLLWVAVLPVAVMEQGREPPQKGSVGVSRMVLRMVQGNSTLPVEAIMQVW